MADRNTDPHLRTFRDGWRTLRLFLVFSPKWTFFRPGLVLIGWRCWVTRWRFRKFEVFGAAHRCPHAVGRQPGRLLGWQCVLLATLARIFAGREGMMPPHEKLEKLTVERGLSSGS